ncbi:MAG TPA: tRNA lysidine(34) synthetase TilS [Parafilimonas sp.]|nr:tRNA lysidine(34) synthetase TilS [Parafilimonas sp.]
MLLQQFQQYLKENFPRLLSPNLQLLLAVSGGIDSVVMLDLFFQSGFGFAIAHCNFQLREEESDRDEMFVRSLGEKYNKDVFVKKFDTKQYAADKKISIQEAARELRYEWFGKLVSGELSVVSKNTNDLTHHSPPHFAGQAFTTHFLATAHNADDNIETMLMFLFRGTGIHGLTGITAFDKERKIIRPLLFVTRRQIELYAEENNLNWVEDSSNATDKYTRNFFRHKIIPLAEEHFSNAKENLLVNIQRLKDAEVLYNEAIDLHKRKLLEYKGNEIHIPILKLQQTKPLDTIIWEIIKAFNFHAKQIDEVKKLFVADNSSYVQSSSHRIIKNRKWLIIAPNENEASNFILIEKSDQQIKFKNGVLQFEWMPTLHFTLQTLNSIAQLDAKHIQYPLLLRKWKQGDYFYPLGMQKKKKLSRFFIDQKLSATAKENIWVLEMNKKIIWVIGYRIDDRCKITASTKEILKISFTPLQQS